MESSATTGDPADPDVPDETLEHGDARVADDRDPAEHLDLAPALGALRQVASKLHQGSSEGEK